MSDHVTPAQQAAREMAARIEFRIFARLMHYELSGGEWSEKTFHIEISDFLDRAFKGQLRTGYINIPPRSGKTYLLCLWIAWCFGRYPNSKFIYITYGAELAEESAILVKRILATPLYRRIFPKTTIDPLVNAREKFHTKQGGAMLARGIGGSLTGYGGGVFQPGDEYMFSGALIFDDLHKIEEARSDIMKAVVKSFFHGTFNTRRNDLRCPIIGIGQRVAPDDIFGLLNPEDGSESLTGEKYEVLAIPMLDEEGNSIWPEKFSTEWCHAYRKAQPWTWATQYMQKPYNIQGAFFDVTMMPKINVRPPGPALRCRGWDLAARELKKGRTEPDFTANLMLAYFPSTKQYVIEDANQFRSTPEKVRANMRAVAARDGFEPRIRIPQDPGQAGVSQAQDLVAMLPGHNVKVSRPTGDKVARAEPVAAQLNVGLIGCMEGCYELVKGQLLPFPGAPHDDLVDALSEAYAELAIPDEDELARIRAVADIGKLKEFEFLPGGERARHQESIIRPAGFDEGEEVI